MPPLSASSTAPSTRGCGPPELKSALAKVGNVPIGGSPERSRNCSSREQQKWAPIVRALNLKANDATALRAEQRQLGRRASDSHRPPPIRATPDNRPSSFARHDCMNHARPSPAAIAQLESVTAARATETAHITASCRPAGRLGSTNCGRKAVKKAIVFGFESATRAPRQKCTCRRGGPRAAFVPRVAPGLDAEPDQISRADPAQDVE